VGEVQSAHAIRQSWSEDTAIFLDGDLFSEWMGFRAISRWVGQRRYGRGVHALLLQPSERIGLMPVYTLRSQVTHEPDVDPGDGTLEDYIRVGIAIDRDGVEVDRFSIRFGDHIDNNELRDAILYEVKERVRVDYLGVEQIALQDRLSAISNTINEWSKALP